MNQWDRTESPEAGIHKCSPLICDKGTKATQQDKGNVLSTWCWNKPISARKKQTTHLYIDFIFLITINSKCIIDLTMKPKIIKLLEEKSDKKSL